MDAFAIRQSAAPVTGTPDAKTKEDSRLRRTSIS